MSARRACPAGLAIRLEFRCGCSREPVHRELLGLGRAELEDLLTTEGRAEATCEFCTTRYLIPGDAAADADRRRAAGLGSGRSMPSRSTRRRPEAPERALSPQSELPRGLLGQDRSGPRSLVREMSWAQFDGAVQAMAGEIAADYTCDLVVGIAPGGLYVGSALASALGKPFHPVRILGRTRDPLTGRMPKLMAMPRLVKGARILLVDDVIASGMTLRRAIEGARRAGARQIRTATLLCRDQGATPDWTVLVMDGPLVFPWDYGPVTEDGRFDLTPEPEPEPASPRARSRA